MGIDKYCGNYTYCATYAIFDCYFKQTGLSMDIFEILTSVPFGVGHQKEYPHRILSPYYDPSLGLKRACKILNQEYISKEFDDGDEALECLLEQLNEGSVVIGPINMGKLDYLAKSSIFDKVPHYVSLYKNDNKDICVNDSEGYIGYLIPLNKVLGLWKANDLVETKYSYNLKYIVQNTELPNETEQKKKALFYAIENLKQAKNCNQGAYAFDELWNTVKGSGTKYYNNLFFDLEILIQRKYLLLKFIDWIGDFIENKAREVIKNKATEQIICAANINHHIRRKESLDQSDFIDLKNAEYAITQII